MNPGIFYAAGAYVLWGLFPIYFKTVAHVASSEVLAHRIVWSLAVVLVLLALKSSWSWIGTTLRQPKVLAGFALSGTLIAANWGIYIWAVANNHVVDASLGYFINPLVNIVFAAVLLGERLRRLQWIAVGIAASGVLWLTWAAGTPPWIGLALALTFASYGLLRKTAVLGSLEGLALETALLFPFALAWLAWLGTQGHASYVEAPLAMQLLLVAAGPITALPLLLFATGARRIAFSTLGLLQYIGPTLQFAIGIWLYREPFDGSRAIGFVLIWAALAIFSIESLFWLRRSRATPATVARRRPHS
ncbi:MAG: EamA family transporter RarD [Burkholderiaceae bacterium]